MFLPIWSSRRGKNGRKRLGKYAKRYAKGKYNFYRRGYKYGKRVNDKYDVVGLTPDHLVSPIDFVPYVNVANKTYRVGKYSYRGYKAVKTSKKVRKYRKKVVREGKTAYRVSQRSSPRRSSSPNRRTSQYKRRGSSSRYYYYRGKRYERKYRR